MTHREAKTLLSVNMLHNSHLPNLERNRVDRKGSEHLDENLEAKQVTCYITLYALTQSFMTPVSPRNVKDVALRIHGHLSEIHIHYYCFSQFQRHKVLYPTAVIDEALLLTGFMWRSERNQYFCSFSILLLRQREFAMLAGALQDQEHSKVHY